MAIHRIWFAPSSCWCRTICSTGPATCSRSLDNEKRPLCRPSVSSPSTASPASRRSHRWSSAQQNHIHNIIKVHTSELVGISNQPYNSGFRGKLVPGQLLVATWTIDPHHNFIHGQYFSLTQSICCSDNFTKYYLHWFNRIFE